MICLVRRFTMRVLTAYALGGSQLLGGSEAERLGIA